ncbi:MAG TPA: methyltransferase domain-containing protein [Stellaceae bacterium]|nr:methyltransferase domain-containing protein [Stellaceae bacterium]
MRAASAIIGLALLMMASPLSASEAATDSEARIGPLAPPGAPASAFPKPARPVASIVADQWSTEEARDRDGEAAEVMQVLDIHSGMSVADVGAGGGYYTVRVAKKVGASGHVIAEDVVRDYLEGLRQRLEREHLDNVRLDLGEPHDPRLPPRSVDLVLMVHMYHEVEQPYGLLYNLLPALRPGARVAVIDLDQATEIHGTPRKLLLCEFHALGFRQTHWGWLRAKKEYLAVFAPPAQRIAPEQIKACTP